MASPADVLLNFDLDPCAIGFTGTDVFLLPRCARALETGYTVFTTDLVEGHHLGDRCETQLPRIYKYADRGFGIRILPQYLRHLKHRHIHYFATRPHDWDPEGTLAASALQSEEAFEHARVKRGLRLLRMLAYYMDNFVHRLWVGRTARSRFVDPDGLNYYSEPDDSDGELGDEYRRHFNVIVAQFDGRTQNRGATPHGQKGLGGFELLCWHEALWRKELNGLVQ